MNKNFSISECFAVGWARFKEHAWFLMGSTLAMYVSAFFFAFLTEEFYFGIEPTRSTIDVISNIVLYWISFGMSVIAFKIIDRKPYSWRDFFLLDIQVLWYFVGTILFGFLSIVGLLFLIVPGIYFMIRYGFFWAAIVDGRKNVLEAFHESAILTRGVKWNLILFYMAVMGVIFLGFLLLGIGILAAIPIVLLASAHLYRVLLQQSLSELQSEQTLNTNTPSREEESLSSRSTTSPQASTSLPPVSEQAPKPE